MSHPIQRFSFHHRGYQLSYLDTHPDQQDRPIVLFLHGFPDTAKLWLKSMDLLSQQGYRCIAPDTLGCGHSEISERESDYNVTQIIQDHIALLNVLQIAKVHVVGHDWGAAAAWFLACYHPERFHTLTALSVGHPGAFAEPNLHQLKASWYILYFKLMGSENLLKTKMKMGLAKVFDDHPNMAEVSQRFKEPQRLVAALNIYRASLTKELFRKHPKCTVPTLGLWSYTDRYCLEPQMHNSQKWVSGTWRYDSIDCHHWIPLAKPEWLSLKLLAHFQSNGLKAQPVVLSA